MNMRLVRFTKGLLDIMFYVGMAITAAIPVIFHYVGMYIEKFRTYYVVQCALYMASGVLALCWCWSCGGCLQLCWQMTHL